MLPISNLNLDGIPHFVVMPRLELFANSGFPFTRLADLAETAVVLPDTPDADQIETYLESLAFFGARTGYPGLRVTVLSPAQAVGMKHKDLLVFTGVGRADLPAAWENSAALQWQQDRPRLSQNKSLLNMLPWLRSTRERAKLEGELNAGPLPDVVLQEFISPADPHRVIAVIQTEAKPEGSPLHVIFAGEPGVAAIFGDISLYRDGWFHSFEVQSTSYYLGQLSWHDDFDFWVGRHFLIVPAILVIFALILAAAVDAWLDRRAKWRLQLET